MTTCSAHLAPPLFFYKLPCRSQNLERRHKGHNSRYKDMLPPSVCSPGSRQYACLPSAAVQATVCLWANFPPEGLPMGSIPCFHAFDTLIIPGDYLSGEARSTQLWSKESRFSGSLSQVRILFCDSASRSSYFMGFYL